MQFGTLVAALGASLISFGPGQPAKAPAPAEKPIQVATMCFFKYEQAGGMNKICYYDCLGSLTAITISSISLCPLSINR